jgi:uncharacterized membrane protein (UPF0136 family)
MHKKAGWVTLIYGLFLISMGLLAYFQSHSMVSLRASLLLGVLIIASAIATLMQKIWGLYGALIFTILLTMIFAWRYSAAGSGITALLAVVSGAMLLFLLTCTAKWKS